MAIDPDLQGVSLQMSGPIRKPVVPAEATQELQASQVLSVVMPDEPLARKAAGRRSLDSQSSISPVGLDLAAGGATDEDDEALHVTAGLTIPPVRRRRLGKIVVGTLAACGLILVAAAVARVSQASSESSAATQSTPNSGDKPASTGTATSTATTPTSAPATMGARGPDSSSSGTVRLDHPAKPGHAWLDGKKISSSSVLVTCGTHQIKIARGRKHSIDVPCGGELGVSR